MAKVKKISDDGGVTLPLRVTQRKAHSGKAPSFRVGCGCCNEGLVVFPPDEESDSDNAHIEINGVMGSRRQWQKVFGSLLNMVPKAAT